MRNLKRVLSLALALVMVLGMMVITTSAATFTDAEEITYQEAVDVMAAIGVIDGIEAADGTFYFDPTETLTREQGAKILCYMLMGKNAAEKLVGSGEFTDVAPTRWSAGAIDYCATLGILDGMGNGKFDPTGPLTAVQYGKMLLCALGYDADIEGYVGKDWATNIALDMLTAGLTNNAIALDEQLTREQAAQMTYQALTSNMVYYMNKGTNITMADGTKIVIGASEATTKYWTDTTGVDYTNADGHTSAAGETVQLCEVVAPKLYKNSYDVNGRYGHDWQLIGATKAFSDFVIDDTVLATVNCCYDTFADLTNKDGYYYVGYEPDTTVEYFLNGAKKTTPTEATNEITNNGVIVEFIDTDRDGLYNTVNVTKKTVATLMSAPVVNTTGGKDYVTIASIGVANKSVAKVIGYENLAKYDVVLYVNLADGTTIVEKADVVTGTVTGNNYYYGALIGENYYYASGLSGASYSDGDITDTKEYNFYLDNAGNIVKAALVTESTVSKYVAVDEFAWVEVAADGTIGSKATQYAQAKLVFTDGTSEIVTVSTIDGFTLIDDATYIKNAVKGATHYRAHASAAAITDGTAGAAVPTDTTAFTAGIYYGFAAEYGGDLIGKCFAVANTATITGKYAEDRFYTYTVNKDGSYNLSTAAMTVKGDSFGNLNSSDNIENGKAVFNGTNIGNSETVFIYAETVKGKDVYTVYTGIANAPTTTNNVGTSTNAIVVNANGVASYVFVKVSGDLESESKDIVYISSANYTVTTGDDAYYIQDAVINGKVATIKLDQNYGVDFYEISKVVDGVYYLNALTQKVGVKNTAGSVLVAGDGTSYTYKSGTSAYVITVTAYGATSVETTIDALTLDATDELYVVAQNGEAKVAYVITKTQAPATVTLAAGSATAATVDGGNLKLSTDAHNVTGTGTSADTVKVTVAAQSNTTIEAISINGESYTSGADYTLAVGTNKTYTVVVTVEDNFSGALTAHSYTFTASIANP